MAERQHGVVSRRQLLAIGFGREEIARRLRSGRLRPLHSGVYAVGHRSLTRRGHWIAAVLACEPSATLSHGSAAALWRLRDPEDTIHVTVPRKGRSRGALRRHYGKLPADERTITHGIPVTSPTRTVFDLAVSAEPQVVEAALRQLVYRRLGSRLSLPGLLARYPRHPGAAAVRLALARQAADPKGRIRSPFEEAFLPFLDHHRLPRPRLNAWLAVAERRYQVDCLWADAGLVVELDGFAAHGNRRAFREDRERDRRLTVAGYRVIRIAREQLDREPAGLAQDLHALISAAA